VRSEFGADDARLLAREGFTVVRLPSLWAGVEPQPGQYDDAYIRRVLRIALLVSHVSKEDHEAGNPFPETSTLLIRSMTGDGDP
jgi:hypothetical protein